MLLDHLAFARRAHARGAGAAGKQGARRALVEHFPFALIYTLNDEDELVVRAEAAALGESVSADCLRTAETIGTPSPPRGEGAP